MPTTFDIGSHDLRDRPAALAEGLARLPVALDVSAVGPTGEYGFTTATEHFGSIFLASCRGWGAEVHRDHRHVARDHERTLLLSLATSGIAEYRQEATTIQLAAGGLVQYCSTIPFAATLNNVARHTLMIPYAAVDLPGHLIEARAGQLVDTTTPLGRIVTRYLRDLGAHGIYLPPPTGSRWRHRRWTCCGPFCWRPRRQPHAPAIRCMPPWAFACGTTCASTSESPI